MATEGVPYSTLFAKMSDLETSVSRVAGLSRVLRDFRHQDDKDAQAHGWVAEVLHDEIDKLDHIMARSANFSPEEAR